MASSVVKSEAAIVRSSCIFKTKGAFNETAKELVAINERLKINAAKIFMWKNITIFVQYAPRF